MLGLVVVVQAVLVTAKDAATYPIPSDEKVLSVTNFAEEFLVWPTGSLPPGENASSPFPNETKRCLTHRVPVAKCKDKGVYDVSIPTLRPYLVPSAKSAMIIAPGGGYGFLAIDREGSDIADWLNSIGVNAFVLKVRLVVYVCACVESNT